MARRAGIAHQYIVVLKGALPIKPTKRSQRKARAEDKRVASSVKATPLFLYDADLKGFAAHLTNAQLRSLRHSARVQYVAQDTRVKEVDTQTSAPWDLDRIDQPSLPLDLTYHYSSMGAGVRVYYSIQEYKQTTLISAPGCPSAQTLSTDTIQTATGTALMLQGSSEARRTEWRSSRRLSI
jgi:hypothetical protein